MRRSAWELNEVNSLIVLVEAQRLVQERRRPQQQEPPSWPDEIDREHYLDFGGG